MDQIPTLEVLYRRVGEDRVRQFGLDSAINCLPYDRHGEELAVQSFAGLLRPDWQSYDITHCPPTAQLVAAEQLQSGASGRSQCRRPGRPQRLESTQITSIPASPQPQTPGCLFRNRR